MDSPIDQHEAVSTLAVLLAQLPNLYKFHLVTSDVSVHRPELGASLSSLHKLRDLRIATGPQHSVLPLLNRLPADGSPLTKLWRLSVSATEVDGLDAPALPSVVELEVRGDHHDFSLLTALLRRAPKICLVVYGARSRGPAAAAALAIALEPQVNRLEGLDISVSLDGDLTQTLVRMNRLVLLGLYDLGRQNLETLEQVLSELSYLRFKLHRSSTAAQTLALAVCIATSPYLRSYAYNYSRAPDEAVNRSLERSVSVRQVRRRGAQLMRHSYWGSPDTVHKSATYRGRT